MHLPQKIPYNLERFKIKGTIGKGSYAEIYEATDLADNKPVVLKQLNQADYIKKGKESEVHVERFILKTYSKRHPGLIELYRIFRTDDSIYLVLEHCPYGDLGNLFQNSSRFKFEEWDHMIREYIYQISLILIFLHSMGICHLDVKPQNLVIDKNKNLKLIDFGTAHFKDEIIFHHTKDKQEYEQIRLLIETKLTSFVGTPQYLSPEMIKYSLAHEEADLWALGCILYEAYYGIQPFDDDLENKVYENILELRFQTQEPKLKVPNDAEDLISKLLVLQPQARIGAQNPQDLLNHPFFDQIRSNNHWNEPFHILTDFSFLQIQPDFSRENSFFLPEVPQFVQESAPKISDATTKLKLSMGDLHIGQVHPNQSLKTERIPRIQTMILMKSRWSCFPKPYLLVIEIERKIFKIMDFKRVLFTFEIDEKTNLQKFGKSDIKIFKEGKSGFNYEFSLVESHFNWDQIIHILKFNLHALQ